MSRKFKIRDQEAAHSSAGNYAKLSDVKLIEAIRDNAASETFTFYIERFTFFGLKISNVNVQFKM